jgi:tRNA A-37 threonylcarbamoyl transferase component Bud32
MKTGIGCPDAEELRQLLGGSLSGERQQDCTDHMDTCSGCQSRLEELATSGTDLPELVKRLDESSPAATSAYWPALKALAAGEQPPAPPPAKAKLPNVSLSFLQPASDSAYLGRLGHFDVMRVLGRGGMGVVLEAFDSRLHRNVALKVLDPELVGDDVSRQRFCREARAAASITHENVVAVHQVEKDGNNGLPFLVMQVVAGESLEQRLAREKKLPLREIVRIGMQAAHGLAAAHEQGLIHRDIKPGNILLESPHDRVKLTDFGLARALDDVKLTHTGFVSGTPLYMAPEQAMGSEADNRSDLFSLGAVMYEMCAGQPPFPGNSALAILKQITEVKHRPLSELNPDVPDWLAKTVDRLLAKKPGDRFQSAAELAELFDFLWARIQTSSGDLPTVCKVEKARRAVRNRWIGALVGVTFLAIGLLGGKYLANRSAATTAAAAATPAPTAVLSTSAGAVWAVAFDPASDTVAMGVEDGSVRLWDLASKTIKETLSAHRGNVWASRFSPSGDLLATAGDDGAIKLWKSSHPVALRVFQHPTAVRALAFGPDGKTLFAGDHDGGLRVWSVDADEPLVKGEQPGAVHAVAISPNGETLASAGSDKIVRLWNAKTLAQKLPLEGHAGPVYGLSFDHDGGRLASVGWDKTVRIWDASSGQLLKSWPGHDADIWGVAFSPTGSTLATGGLDGTIKLWNADTGKLLATFLADKGGIQTVAFNRDGTLLGAGSRDGAVRIWKVE